MLKILNIFTRILDVIMADGEKRLKYSIENIIYIAFAVGCAYGTYRLIGYVSTSLSQPVSWTWEGAGLIALSFVGIVSCVLAGLYALIAGIVSQAVLVVFSFLGIIISRSRGKNLVAFIISVISLGVCAVAVLYIFGYLPPLEQTGLGIVQPNNYIKTI